MSKKNRLEIPEEFKNSEPELIADAVQEEVIEIPKAQGIPAGFTLCKVEGVGDTPYTIYRNGVAYTFSPPSFTCPLPSELAAIYNEGKHIIKIA